MGLISKRFSVLSAVAVLNIAVVPATAPNYTLGANIILVLLMVKASLFVGLYAFRSNWRATAAGRAIMGLIGCVATICGVGTLNLFLGDYSLKPFVRLICFIAVGLMLMNLLLTLVDAQRDKSDREDTEE